MVGSVAARRISGLAMQLLRAMVPLALCLALCLAVLLTGLIAVPSHASGDEPNPAAVAPAQPAQLAQPAQPAQPTSDQAAPAEPPPGKPYLGAALEWAEDDAAAFADRLGAKPAILVHEVSFPVRDNEKTYIRQYLQQTATLGAHALLSVQPSVPLDEVGDDAAAEFARAMEEVAEGFSAKLFIRFAPDMNASWVDWGQQPSSYVSAFRAVARAFEPYQNAVMVWQPFAGKDYPYEENRNARAAGTPGFAELDTNDDGSWNGADDPYAPYYPGDDVVDWVAFSAYHDDTGGQAARNTLPEDKELAGMLTANSVGAARSEADFYASYAVARNKPLALQTAAFYSPTTGGPPEAEIKGAWWQQVLGLATSKEFDRIGAVIWDERTDTRGSGDVNIDWRLTGQPDIAAKAGAAVVEFGLTTAPVTETAREGGGGPAVSASSSNTLAGPAAVVVGLGVLVAAAALWLIPGRVRAARRWAYPEETPRDSRVDMLRGLAIVFVVVNHLGMVSLFQLVTQEAIGFVSGAELFVLLSGLVLGMVYGPRAKENLGEVVDKAAKRAGKLYATALVVVGIVFLIGLLPSFNAEALTTFTDQGTGAAGRDASGRNYDLYAGMDSILQFPVPPSVVPAILLLQFGPWQFNVMGLYIVMLLMSPAVLAALARGKALWVLLATFAVYFVGTFFRFRLLPSQFEDSFPLLVWQLLFVLGLVGGYYRRRLVDWLSGHSWVVALCAGITVACAFLSWANPYLSSAYDFRLAILPDASYRALYDLLFGRTYLEPGRLLNVLALLVTAYALLTAYWKPLERALGWLLIPLGRATLYVFIVHVALIAVVSNIPWLHQGNILLNTLAYAVIVALLWVMVRARFLFRVIPT
jgi:hypothetical protein